MPQDAPPHGSACVVIDCDWQATAYAQVVDAMSVDQESSIAMCDEHARNWRDGYIG